MILHPVVAPQAKLALMIPLTKGQHVVMTAPIIEEITFRLLFQMAWHKISLLVKQIQKRKQQDGDIVPKDKQANEDNLWYGAIPWVLVSSLWFGIFHLTNHLPCDPSSGGHGAGMELSRYTDTWDGPGETNFEKVVERWGISKDQHDLYWSTGISIVKACCHMTSTTWISLNILCPMYVERGLGASIGAHVAWNFFAAMSVTNTLLRVYIRSCKQLWRVVTTLFKTIFKRFFNS
jgi:membrane protease YdiL (CAAX protease family)